jgi:hypothetical protein
MSDMENPLEGKAGLSAPAPRGRKPAGTSGNLHAPFIQDHLN